MTRRERISAVFEMRGLERPPVSVRLDLWHQNRKTNTLPERLKDFSQEQVEDYLGFCRAARYRLHPEIEFPSIELRQSSTGREKIDEYLFPQRTLVRKTAFSSDPSSKALLGHITKYPLETQDDYDAMLANMADAILVSHAADNVRPGAHTVDFDFSEFDRFDKQTGDAGLPILIVGYCPAHSVMLNYTGYKNFYFHLADFPEKVDELTNRIDRIYRRDLWPALCKTNAKLILHGAHFSSQMTPPPIFERYFQPYFKAFNDLMHRHDKKVLWHADAEMGALLNHVLRAGFDGADCLVTYPLAPQRIEDYFTAWQERIVCWGGLPSIIFDPAFDMEEYKKYVDDLVESTRNSKNFIFGASDNVMSGAEWERLVYLARAAGTVPETFQG